MSRGGRVGGQGLLFGDYGFFGSRSRASGEAPVGVDLVGGEFVTLGVEVGDYEAAGRLGPFAVFVYAGIGSDGANDLAGGGWDGAGFFQDGLEGAARIVGSYFEEAEGVRVAVNHGAVAEFEFFSEVAGAGPVEEGLLDGVALGVIADGAFDLVIFEAGFVAAGRIVRFTLLFPIWEF